MTETQRDTNQAALIAALMDPTVYRLPAGEQVERLETHISYVYLAGAHAYKIKKAVDLGFLNFTTLGARRFYCGEELRLNRRLAPTLYLAVVPIAGTPARPVLGSDGPAIEWAVKMRRFPQDGLLDRLLARGELTPAHIDELAATTAEFHGRSARAGETDAFGTPDAILQPVRANFAALRAHGAEPLHDIDEIERWSLQQHAVLAPTLRARKRDGFVRECHGDLHLRNIALVDGEITLFDCIEFDPQLRWIDVMSEVAFVVMDLYDRDEPALARRFLNRYLEATGDYAGLPVLRFYIAYRALVRAKIHCIRARQPELGHADRARLLDQYRGYVALAQAQAHPDESRLIITHGVSGSGKTTCTQPLLEAVGAVRIRSDIERKRLQGLAPLARTASPVGGGSYAADATVRTYERLLELAGSVIDAGYTAIVDATFLTKAQRDMFRRAAITRGRPFVILDIVADEATMRARIHQRLAAQRDASEADLAVLEHQLATQEPLQPDELSYRATIDSTRMTEGIPAGIRESAAPPAFRGDARPAE